MRYRIYALMIVTCMTLVSIIGYLAVSVVHNASPLQRIQSSQEIANSHHPYMYHCHMANHEDGGLMIPVNKALLGPSALILSPTKDVILFNDILINKL